MCWDPLNSSNILDILEYSQARPYSYSLNIKALSP